MFKRETHENLKCGYSDLRETRGQMQALFKQQKEESPRGVGRTCLDHSLGVLVGGWVGCGGVYSPSRAAWQETPIRKTQHLGPAEFEVPMGHLKET